jgi:hypothetical protein
MVYVCAPADAIFDNGVVTDEYEAVVDRELFADATDVDRLCPEKKWGLTSNDETIEAIMWYVERSPGEMGVAIHNAVASQAKSSRVVRFMKK